MNPPVCYKAPISKDATIEEILNLNEKRIGCDEYAREAVEIMKEPEALLALQRWARECGLDLDYDKLCVHAMGNHNGEFVRLCVNQGIPISWNEIIEWAAIWSDVDVMALAVKKGQLELAKNAMAKTLWSEKTHHSSVRKAMKELGL